MVFVCDVWLRVVGYLVLEVCGVWWVLFDGVEVFCEEFCLFVVVLLVDVGGFDYVYYE